MISPWEANIIRDFTDYLKKEIVYNEDFEKQPRIKISNFIDDKVDDYLTDKVYRLGGK